MRRSKGNGVECGKKSRSAPDRFGECIHGFCVLMNQGSHSIQSGPVWLVDELKGSSGTLAKNVRRLRMARFVRLFPQDVRARGQKRLAGILDCQI